MSPLSPGQGAAMSSRANYCWISLFPSNKGGEIYYFFFLSYENQHLQHNEHF